MQDTTTSGALSRDPVLIAMAVREIAQRVAKPGETPRQAETRVRNRIDYAVKKSALNLIDDPHGLAVPRGDFCEWAVKKWPKVIPTLPGYAHRVNTVVGQLTITGHAPTVVVMNLESHEWLREHYPRCEAERQRLQLENAELHQRVDALEVELDGLRLKKELRRERASEFGKKGGRGRSL